MDIYLPRQSTWRPDRGATLLNSRGIRGQRMEKLNNLGINPWANRGLGNEFPSPSDHSWKYSPGELADYWCVGPAELTPAMAVAICQQFRKGAIISHPDKPPFAPTWIIDELERVFVGMVQARDGMILWLNHLKDGRAQAPRKH